MVTAALMGCSQKADTSAEKAATDVKDKVVADAKAAEALVKEKEARDAGIDAYIYAYPLVTDGDDAARYRPTSRHRRGARRRWASLPGCAGIRPSMTRT